MPVNALQALLKKPNPIAMSRWVTIGTLNPDEWTTVFEGRWRQRNGKILVDGAIAGRFLISAEQAGRYFELDYPLPPSERPALAELDSMLSALRQWDLSEEDAIANEMRGGLEVIASGETLSGATRFASGVGRHGAFSGGSD